MQRSSSPLHSRKLVPPADSTNIPTRIAPQPEPINRRVRGEDDQEGNRALIPDTSSGSISSRSASGSSTKESETASSSNSEPAGSQQHNENQASSPTSRVPEIIGYINEHFGVDWPETGKPYRHVSRQDFDLFREILFLEHPQADKKLRCDYDPETEELTLFMPLRLHDEAAGRLADLILAKSSEVITPDATLVARKLPELKSGGCRVILDGGVEKYPDACILYPGYYYPSLVIEVAHSQDADELATSAEDYYHDSKHSIRTVLTLDIEYWARKKRYTMEDRRKKKEVELGSIDRQLAMGNLSGEQLEKKTKKKERLKEKLEKLESVRRRGAYNLYTENSAKTGLDSKFDYDDKVFFPTTDLNDFIELEIGWLFPREILPANDPDARRTIQILHSELSDILATAEAEQRKEDNLQRSCKTKDDSSRPLSGKARNVMEKKAREAKIERRGAIDRSVPRSPTDSSYSPSSDDSDTQKDLARAGASSA